MTDDEKLREEFQAIHYRFEKLEKKVDEGLHKNTELIINEKKKVVKRYDRKIAELKEQLRVRIDNQHESDMRTLDVIGKVELDVRNIKEVLREFIKRFIEDYTAENKDMYDDLLSKLDGEKSVHSKIQDENLNNSEGKSDSTPSKCPICKSNHIGHFKHTDNYLTCFDCMLEFTPKEPTDDFEQALLERIRKLPKMKPMKTIGWFKRKLAKHHSDYSLVSREDLEWFFEVLDDYIGEYDGVQVEYMRDIEKKRYELDRKYLAEEGDEDK